MACDLKWWDAEKRHHSCELTSLHANHIEGRPREPHRCGCGVIHAGEPTFRQLRPEVDNGRDA
jgi:hypothetical protein